VNTLAIDIGGTKLAMALFESHPGSEPTIVRREFRHTKRDGGREWMLGQIEDVIVKWRAVTSIDRCGIGFGGPVNFATQRVALSTHVGGWTDFPLGSHLGHILGAPVVMDNDANTGALGEAIYGAGKGARPLFYVTLSTGIGGGIIVGSEEKPEVYRGADSYAGEIGHLTIRPEGPECLCGSRGCLERLCCGLWLEKDYGKPPAELLRDPTFVAKYVVDLSLGLKATIMLLNPARIVIGGGISQVGDALFVPLRAELRRQIPEWSKARIDVMPAGLGADHVLWGAYAIAQAVPW
jgi:glucokinase